MCGPAPRASTARRSAAVSTSWRSPGQSPAARPRPEPRRARPPSRARSADPAVRPEAAVSSTVPVPAASGTKLAPGRPRPRAAPRPARPGVSAGRSPASTARRRCRPGRHVRAEADRRVQPGARQVRHHPGAQRRRPPPDHRVVGDHQDLGHLGAGQHRGDGVAHHRQGQILVPGGGHGTAQPGLRRAQPLDRNHRHPVRQSHPALPAQPSDLHHPASRIERPPCLAPAAPSRHDFVAGDRGRRRGHAADGRGRDRGAAQARILAAFRGHAGRAGDDGAGPGGPGPARTELPARRR